MTTNNKKVSELYYYLYLLGFEIFSICPIKQGTSFVFVYKIKNTELFTIHITLKKHTYVICEYKNLFPSLDSHTFISSLTDSSRFQSTNVRRIASSVERSLTILRRLYNQLM